MTFSALRDTLRAVAATEMAQDSAHDLAHLDRVWTTCERIALAEGGDMRVLLAGAYLHDLVNLPKDAPNRKQASTLAAAAAEPHLVALEFTMTEIAATKHIIAAHSFSAGIEPNSPEALILRDADRLDAIGAIGIARAFGVSGQLGRPIYNEADPFARGRTPDDTQFSVDHWPIKLLKLPEGIATKTGKEIAQERIKVMHQFLHDLAHEIGAKSPKHWID